MKVFEIDLTLMQVDLLDEKFEAKDQCVCGKHILPMEERGFIYQVGSKYAPISHGKLKVKSLCIVCFKKMQKIYLSLKKKPALEAMDKP